MKMVGNILTLIGGLFALLATNNYLKVVTLGEVFGADVETARILGYVAIIVSISIITFSLISIGTGRRWLGYTIIAS